MELHHARREVRTWGAEEEGAWAFPWGWWEGGMEDIGMCWCWSLPWAGASLGLVFLLSFSSETLWDDEQLSH